eukprot:GHVL01042710.1.p1 GENE.GHVL01042710.1~~GHVL01042710.1.p1  ORF type:complete len:190 (+),score=69.50 GHVL01042710.1:35-604(+)
MQKNIKLSQKYIYNVAWPNEDRNLEFQVLEIFEKIIYYIFKECKKNNILKKNEIEREIRKIFIFGASKALRLAQESVPECILVYKNVYNISLIQPIITSSIINKIPIFFISNINKLSYIFNIKNISTMCIYKNISSIYIYNDIINNYILQIKNIFRNFSKNIYLSINVGDIINEKKIINNRIEEIKKKN